MQGRLISAIAITKDKSLAQNTNAVKESKRLLDIISEVKNVATALEHFEQKHSNKLGATASKNLGVLINSLHYICNDGIKQTATVSKVSYLLQVYHKCKKDVIKRKRDTQTR